MLDLNALRDFVAVIQDGGFSAAARRLGMPVSTISKRVQDLEARLGTRLIERTTRSLRLTPEGAALHARAARIIADVEDAERLLRQHGDEPKGHLRVSCPFLFGQAFMGRIAAAYRARHPDATIEIVLADQRVNLIEQGFDAAIRVGPLESSGLIARHVAEADSVVVAAPALLASGPRPLHPAELVAHPCLAFRVDHAGRSSWSLRRDLEVAEVAVRPVISIDSLVALRDATLAGAGFAYLPRFVVAEDLREGRLALAFEDWAGSPQPISIVYPSSRFLTGRLRAFIDLVADEFPQRRL